MKLKKKTKIILIVVSVVVILLITWLLITWPSLIAPVLWTLLVLGIGFFALDFWQRSKKKKKQRQFDEKVSAKEGIEDRKREWQGWVDELEKQGIDRYELPFYLVVGEPQSGKSVLLQNSDLYFPFGQERLSGVGGTRGCDWWFTDEAVILDIAGRLFTHEGGVADKLEWEAFLDQLNEFRPMSPANGVLLIIPCDALLEDSADVCAEKANKIQSALLTLTQKLEAQLPVYLVLTKGDRIFGFAESVHRMDSEQRHQMFGWSREADKIEQPFALAEAKAGYARLVDRARLLRERMISTARLPEALPEIDRLYAFPDELEGMYASLEIYLQRIFTESNLVDRASFRGIYLTSGLQTGAPIAKVCADLLGDDRESDARALEGLFSHQRAYFIKDLVRKRVFAERGLVRPTEGRVASARRKAVMGFGAAGLLALASIVGAVWHIASGPDAKAASKLELAIEAANKGADTTDLTTLLNHLGTLNEAIGIKRGAVEETFGKTREELSDLYIKLCKEILVPNLRTQLEERMEDKIGPVGSKEHEPEDADQARRWVEAIKTMCNDVDFSSKEGALLTEEFLPNVRTQVGGKPFTIQVALEQRGGGWTSPLGGRTRLERLSERGKELLNGLVDATKPWMHRSHLGFMIAWEAAEQAEKNIGLKGANHLYHCDIFANSVKVLKVPPGKDVTYWQFKLEMGELSGLWDDLETFLGVEEPSWPRTKEVMLKADNKFSAYEGSTVYQPNAAGIVGLAGGFARILNSLSGQLTAKSTAGFTVTSVPASRWTDATNQLFRDCDDAPHANWTLKSLSDNWRKLTRDGKQRSDEYARKLAQVAEELPTKIARWQDARLSYHGADGAPPEGTLDMELAAGIAAICDGLGVYSLTKGSDHLSDVLFDHLEAVGNKWGEAEVATSSIDWDIVKTLGALANNQSVKTTVSDQAVTVAWDYLDPRETMLRNKWSDGEQSKHSTRTLELLGQFNDHLKKLQENWNRGSGSWPPDNVGDNHGIWLTAIDKLLGSRLETHQGELMKHWSPDSEAMSGELTSVVAAVASALTDDAINKKIDTDKAARKSRGSRDGNTDWPPHRSTELRANSLIAKVAKLTRINTASAYLRTARTPNLSQVKDHPLFKELTDLATKIGSADDETLAKLTVGMQSLAPKKTPAGQPAAVATPEEHYLRGIYKGLRDRLVQHLRARYLQELSGLLTPRNANLIEALYTGTGNLAAINGANDYDVTQALATLLDPREELDQLAAKYKMRAVKKDDPTLHPGAATNGIANEDWWKFEQFLVSLQEFFQGGAESKVRTKVRNANVELQMEPLYEGGSWEGVWDFDTTRKSFCFFVSEHGKDKTQKVSNSSTGAGWSAMKGKRIKWKFPDRKKAPLLWFAWTTKAVGFSWETDTEEKHLRFGLKGNLAPLLWCWAGDQELWDKEAGWLVKAEPTHTTEVAGFRMTYWKDGKRLPLPKRPERPTSSL